MTTDNKMSLIKNAVNCAIDKLKLNDEELFDVNINERSISHKLAEYLQQEFTGWNVDCEYNRKMKDRKTLNVSFNDVKDDDIEAKTVFPDIIVHRRQTHKNLLVIEIKKKGMSINKDKTKLEAFTGREYDYCFGLLLILKNNDFKRLWFTKGKQIKRVSKKNIEVLEHGG
ncbi:MAG: hypothetical protein SCM96_08565 [Acidobacteriota bacterium]|nr:hypothetical protein [Acidobacteriota bacterium]